MGAPHYALSEALIVIAACWVAWRLAKGGLWLGAVGTILFGLAAAIGTIRFGLNLADDLAAPHRISSQAGGATAMAFVALQCAMPPAVRSLQLLVSVGLAAATLVAALFLAQIATPLFIAWLGIAILASFFRPVSRKGLRLLRAGVIAIFLFNILLIRRSPLLGPSLSWHLFHIMIAVWILGLWWVLAPSGDQKDHE